MSNRRLFTLLLAFSLLGAFSVRADGETGTGSTPNPESLKLRPGNPWYPHAPSRMYIECIYGKGYIQFFLPEGIYSLSVTIFSDSYSWSGFVTRDQSVLELPELEGSYTVKCNADDGKTYYGTIEF